MSDFLERLVTPFSVHRFDVRVRGALRQYSHYYVFGIRVAVVQRWPE